MGGGGEGEEALLFFSFFFFFSFLSETENSEILNVLPGLGSGDVQTTGSDLTFFKLLHRQDVLLFFLGGQDGSIWSFRSTAFVPETFGHVVYFLVVFGGTVILNMIDANSPTFNLKQEAD